MVVHFKECIRGHAILFINKNVWLGMGKVFYRGYCCGPNVDENLDLRDNLCLDELKKLLKKAKQPIIKDIKKDKWPRMGKLQNSAFETMCSLLCQFSYEKKDNLAFKLIDECWDNPIFRVIAINKVSSSSGKMPGIDSKIISTKEDKIKLYHKTNKLYIPRHQVGGMKIVEVPKLTGGFQKIGIGTILDRVLQTLICIFLSVY